MTVIEDMDVACTYVAANTVRCIEEVMLSIQGICELLTG